MQEQQTERTYSQDARTAFNVIYLMLCAWSITIYLMLRRGTGKEHCGLRGILGLGFPILFSLFARSNAVLLVIPIYLVSLVVQRIGHVRDYMRGDVVHTQYSGYPWLALKLRENDSELKAKTITEPMFVFFLGIGLSVISHGLGAYYIGGAGAMLFVQLMANWHDRKRIDRMNDSMIENRYFADRLRKNRQNA